MVNIEEKVDTKTVKCEVCGVLRISNTMHRHMLVHKRIYYDKTCPVCSKTFTTRNSKQTFCSHNCQVKGKNPSIRKPKLLICLGCGKESLSTHTKFCSEECGNNYACHIKLGIYNCRVCGKQTTGRKRFCPEHFQAWNKGRSMEEALGSKKFEQFTTKIMEANKRIQRTDKYHRGLFTSIKNNSIIKFDSSYELLMFIKLENDIDVIKYGRCDFSIPYMFGGRWKRYFPDLMVERSSGQLVILEIKREDQINNDDVICKIKAGEQYCKDNGMLYEITGCAGIKITSSDVDLANVEFFNSENKQRFLSKHRLGVVHAS